MQLNNITNLKLYLNLPQMVNLRHLYLSNPDYLLKILLFMLKSMIISFVLNLKICWLKNYANSGLKVIIISKAPKRNPKPATRINQNKS